MGDDLMGLAVIVVLAGGAFYLLTREEGLNLGPADADVDEALPDADVTGSGTPTAAGGCNDGTTCTSRCNKRWCSSFTKCCKGTPCAYCKAGKQVCTPCSRNYHRVGTYPCKCAPNKKSAYAYGADFGAPPSEIVYSQFRPSQAYFGAGPGVGQRITLP